MNETRTFLAYVYLLTKGTWFELAFKMITQRHGNMRSYVIQETPNKGVCVWAYLVKAASSKISSYGIHTAYYYNIQLSVHSRTDRKIPIHILYKIYVANAIV